jgi:hypothetical protein
MNQQWVKFGSSKSKTYLLKEVVEGSDIVTIDKERDSSVTKTWHWS